MGSPQARIDLGQGLQEQALIARARALRVGTGATLRAFKAVLETQHGRRLSLDALHQALALHAE